MTRMLSSLPSYAPLPQVKSAKTTFEEMIDACISDLLYREAGEAFAATVLRLLALSGRGLTGAKVLNCQRKERTLECELLSTLCAFPELQSSTANSKKSSKQQEPRCTVRGFDLRTWLRLRNLMLKCAYLCR